MAKKVIKSLKLFIPAGKATPAPPLGPTLGQAGVNIGDFTQKFNAATAQMGNDVLGVVLEVYDDRSYDFHLKTPPTFSLIKKAAGVDKGAKRPGSGRAGTITKAQLRSIAEKKLPDLNANDIDAAMKIVEGQARQGGIEITD